MKLYKFIPSAITSLNLLCGLFAIIFASNNRFDLAVYSILAAGIFDLFDGFAARLLHATSEFGKQLDSLADIISFGVAPSIMLYMIFPESWCTIYGVDLMPFSAFFIALFSAFRLAKFNIDESQTSEFRGLPTPASAYFIVSIVYSYFQGDTILNNSLNNWGFFTAISILISILMVSRIKLISFKVKNFTFNKIIWHIILLLGSVILLIIFNFLGISFAIILYLAVSLVKQIFEQKNN